MKSFLQAAASQLIQIILQTDLLGRRKSREVVLAKLHLEIAAVGDLQGSLHRLGAIVKPSLHFLGRFDIELVGLQFEPVVFTDRFAGLNAEQHVVSVIIRPFAVVTIVGGDHGNREIFC